MNSGNNNNGNNNNGNNNNGNNNINNINNINNTNNTNNCNNNRSNNYNKYNDYNRYNNYTRYNNYNRNHNYNRNDQINNGFNNKLNPNPALSPTNLNQVLPSTNPNLVLHPTNLNIPNNNFIPNYQMTQNYQMTPNYQMMPNYLNLYQELNTVTNINLILSSNLTLLNNHLNTANIQIEKLKKEKDDLVNQVETGKRKYESDETKCTNNNCDNNYGDIKYGDNKYGDNKYGDNKYGDNKYGDNNYGDNNYGDIKYGDIKYGDNKYGYNNYGDNKYCDKYRKINNRYYTKKYYPNSESWSEEKIKEYFKNLKSLKDIMSLKDEWYKIRHNEKMIKLYNIIRPIQKLENMIGLDSVKKEIFKVIIYYIQNSHTDEYLHTVISGPPGVGKTELAKIYSEIFVRLGILKTNKFIEIKRDDLVAEYLGQTSHRTKKLLESAMDGVIFLDEGYSLGNNEKRDSFAKEAIDMINQYLSERKKDFMFVVAGYEQDLEKCFFSFNRGLKRRFSHWINIEKYTREELIKIFELKIKGLGYNLDSTIGKTELNNFFEKNYKKFENYAGDIEKFINYIKYEQSFRCFREYEQNKIINMSDLKNSIEKLKNSESYEPPLGLYC
jgi:hypothetical protein